MLDAELGEANNSYAVREPTLNGRLDDVGGRKASEIAIFIFRMLHLSRFAMLSAWPPENGDTYHADGRSPRPPKWGILEAQKWGDSAAR